MTRSPCALLLAAALSLGTAVPARAAFLRDVPVSVAQPDGTPLDLRVTGDEYHRRLHDARGFTVVRDDASGWWVYADLRGGTLVPTGIAAGQGDPRDAALAPGLDLDPARVLQASLARRAAALWRPAPLLKGSVANLTIFMRFEGDDEMTQRIDDFEAGFNDVSEGSTSMRAYFREASGGVVDITTVFVPAADADGWATAYTDPHTRGYYGVYQAAANPNGYRTDAEAQQREHELLKAALAAVADQVPADLDLDADDDGYADNVVFMIDGPPGDPWAGLLWPHQWAFFEDVAFRGTVVKTYNMNFTGMLLLSTGTFAHEMAHTLGAPDLYHYNQDDLTPVGPWCLMENTGSPPQHPLAYLKWRYLGWIGEPAAAVHGDTVRLAPNQAVHVAAGPDAKQAFWLEYRVKAGTFESSLPGSGLLAYRVDDNVWGEGNRSGPPDEVYVFRPGGRPGVRGKVGLAPLGAFTGRDRMNESTDPAFFLQDGTPVTLRVYDVVEDAQGVTFKVCLQAPDCGAKTCGDDGCGGSCGACGDGTHCVEGGCVPCSCDGLACGDDGCGTSCGTCDDGNACTADACVDGACVAQWLPDGTPCDDGDPCTTGDRCLGTGVCVGTGACVPDDGPDATGGDTTGGDLAGSDLAGSDLPGGDTAADMPPAGDIAGDPGTGSDLAPDAGKKGGKGGCAAGLPGASPLPLALLLAGLWRAARRRRTRMPGA